MKKDSPSKSGMLDPLDGGVSGLDMVIYKKKKVYYIKIFMKKINDLEL
jgi:hypothetical protein